MHAIFSQLSGLAGLIVFLARVWRLAPVDGAMLTGIGAGLAVYAALVIGDLIIRRILAYGDESSDEKTNHGQQSRGTSPNPVNVSQPEEMAMAEASAA